MGGQYLVTATRVTAAIARKVELDALDQQQIVRVLAQFTDGAVRVVCSEACPDNCTRKATS